MSSKASFFIGFVVCFAVFAWNGINVVSLCLIVLALVVIALCGERVVSWIKTNWARLRCQVHSLWEHDRSSSKKRNGKRAQSDREKLMKQLGQQVHQLGEELKGFSQTWQDARENYFKANQQVLPAFTPLEPHRAYWSEYLALRKSLSHLGTPQNSARIQLEDLHFYSAWVSELRQRFGTFQRLYIQQERNVTRALSDAKAFQSKFGSTYHPVKQLPDYWIVYGSYCTLEDLLKDGCIQPESLLPKMQTLQCSMESLLAQQNGVH